MAYQQQQERKWREQQLGAVLTMGGIDSNDYPETGPYGLDAGVGYDHEADRDAQFGGMAPMRQRTFDNEEISTSAAFKRVRAGLATLAVHSRPAVTLVPSQACACAPPISAPAAPTPALVAPDQRVWLSEHKRALAKTLAVLVGLLLIS